MSMSHPNCHGPQGHVCQEPSGRACIEPGCDEAAGTKWGPLWCPAHDQERLDRISASLDEAVRLAADAIQRCVQQYLISSPSTFCGTIGWGATPTELAAVALRSATPALRAQIEAEAVTRAVERIRAEWACGCVEEHPDEPDKWHECCRYSEFAARNALDTLAQGETNG